MIILMDVDGVICDFFGAVKTHLEDCGFHPRPFEEFDMGATLSEEELSVATEWLSRPGTCEHLPFIGEGPGGAQWFVNECRRHGEVFFVTAPWENSYTWAKERKMWLRRHFATPADHVLSVPGSAKHLIEGDFLIEDKPETAAAWFPRCSDGASLLLCHQGNTKDRERMSGTAYTECRDYADILKHLEKK